MYKFLLFIWLVIAGIPALAQDDLYYEPSEKVKTVDLNAPTENIYYHLMYVAQNDLVIWAELDTGRESLTIVKAKLVVDNKVYNKYPTPFYLLNSVCEQFGLKVYSWQVFKEDDIRERFDYLLIKK